jgi:glycosyltransferase involved in cell wall biosynthesis
VDKLDGNFIENHARAVSRVCDLAVLYVGSDPYMTHKQYDWEEKNEYDFRIVRVWYRNNDVSKRGIGRIIKFFRYLKATRIGWQLIRKEFGLPEVTHVHIFTRPVLLAFFLRWKYDIPFLITEHSSHFVHDLPVLLPPMKWFAQFSARNAKFITAVSQTLQHAMMDFGLRGKYRIIPNVVYSNSSSGTALLPQASVNIVAIGGLTDQRKNIKGLIQVFREIHHRIPNARLHIVRPVPDVILYEGAKSTGLLDQKIFFYDYLSNHEVYTLLSQCAFLVVNSISETFSMAAAEALACGKPVISTRCGGPEEFIDEQRGILIDLNSPEQLSEALLRMYTTYTSYDPDQLKAFAMDRFSEDIVGRKLLDIYEEMIIHKNH